jgi:hypothetical protein
LIGELGHRFAAAARLPLTGLLLNQLVRDQKIRRPDADDRARTIGVREIALESQRRIRRRSMIRLVLFGRRIEVAIGRGRAPSY